MAFNAALTLHDLPQFGIVAIRDAATWYYGLFGIVGAAVWYRLGEEGVRGLYRALFLVAYAGAMLVMLASTHVVPSVQVPFSDVALTDFREDAMSVQMIGALAFFLAVESTARRPLPPWLISLCVAMSVALVVATLGRGPLVALVGTIAIMASLGLWRRVAFVLLAGACLMVVLLVTDVQVETSRGVVSASSIVDRQSSIFSYLSDGGAADGDPDAVGTITWRVVWWQSLVDEALADPRVLIIGRGYGPDLRDAVSDMEGVAGNTSYRQGDDVGRPLRSPHNIAMTILARSGLVGLGLWLFMLGAVGWSVIQRVRVARRQHDRPREMFGVWLVVYLAGTVLIACFGVLLEGPFAAIPFFCTLGIAVAWATGRPPEVSPVKTI
jgi:hypothetical protein